MKIFHAKFYIGKYQLSPIYEIHAVDLIAAMRDLATKDIESGFSTAATYMEMEEVHINKVGDPNECNTKSA